MSVLFIGCPHVGHRNIAKYRSFVSSCDDNTQQFVKAWESTVGKRDVVYVMGDAAFDIPSCELYAGLAGRKILIKGNHDDYVPTHVQARVFEEIYGMLAYKGMWLTHCPIHEMEFFRKKGNVHSHNHCEQVPLLSGDPDPRYFNTNVDVRHMQGHGWFTSLDEVKEQFNSIPEHLWPHLLYY